MVSGLSSRVAKERLAKYGPNEIKELFKVSILKIFARQIYSNLIVYLLFVAMVLSFLIGKSITGYTVGLVIFIVIGSGFFQEYRAEKAIKSLRNMIVPMTIVLRDGKEKEILTNEIVPGDIILLRSGEKVPADCIIREANNLRVNESILTGESKEITKEAFLGKGNIFDINKLFMSTLVVSGKAVVEAQHTGMNTQFGKIAGLISTAEKELPLRNKVNDITRFMVFVAIVVSILTGLLLFFGAKEITNEVLIEILIVVIALAVSAFPEGFPIVLTTTLALGAKKMAEKNAIVNRMSIIETLGEATVICSDKTGTITKGEMTVGKIITYEKIVDVTGVGYEGNGELMYDGKKIDVKSDIALKKIVCASVICNDAWIKRTGDDNFFEVRGTPTEGALLVMGAKAGMYKEDLKGERIEEVPFTSEQKSMIVLYKENNNSVVYEKGAPDILINKCEYVLKGNLKVKITPAIKKNFLDKQLMLAKQGDRVIGFAYAPTKKLNSDGKVNGLIFLGLVGMEDPPRPEVSKSIEACFRAGIDVKIITGDHKETAIAIAKQIGFNGRVIEGSELDELSDKELSEIVQGISIFARVRPEHKLRIVRALKEKGEVVAMTGDGVNDAPALKEAHIGIAMGKNGTDVSRESADLTLKDDNFSTIVIAIEEGRTIYANVRKFVAYQLSCNIAELTIIFLGLLIGLPLPLLALQILFMNIVTDDLPAITLGFNPTSKDAMLVKPRRNPSLLDKESMLFMFVSAAIMGLTTLFVFWASLNLFNNDLVVSRTIALVTLIFFEIANAFNFRSFRSGVHELPLNTNKYLIYASVASLVLTVIVIYTPLNVLFETTPINVIFWVFGAVSSLSVVIVLDLLKQVRLKSKEKFLQ